MPWAPRKSGLEVQRSLTHPLGFQGFPAPAFSLATAPEGDILRDLFKLPGVSPWVAERGESFMGQQCAICGKKPAMGNRVTTRGKAKYLGGVGTKVTGIARRQ